MITLEDKRLRLSLREERNRLELTLKHERSMARLDRRQDGWIAGYRGLIALNSSAAIAFGALLQALLKERGLAAVIDSLFIGIAITSLGAVIAALTFMTLYFGSRHKNNSIPLKNPWWWTQMIFTGLSALAFIGSVFFIVFEGLKITSISSCA